MFCIKCGTKINDGDIFCTNCGAKIIIEDDIKHSLLTEQINRTKTISETFENENWETVKFGKYPTIFKNGVWENSQICWYVLEKLESAALLLSSKILDFHTYDGESHDFIPRPNLNWKDCSLRKWLNNDFYNNAFNSDEQNIILTTELKNINTLEKAYRQYIDFEDPSTNDKIFCLSKYDIKLYFKSNNLDYYAPNNYSKRAATSTTFYADHKACKDYGSGYYTDKVLNYWLRSLFKHSEFGEVKIGVDNINGSGCLFYDTMPDRVIGVRPAMWVKF